MSSYNPEFFDFQSLIRELRHKYAEENKQYIYDNLNN